MPSALLDQLQTELRQIASTASAPLMQFINRYQDDARPQWVSLCVDVGHEAKAIARIGQVFSTRTSATRPEAATIEEVISRLHSHGEHFEQIARDYHMDAEMEPFIRMVNQSIQACEKSFDRARAEAQPLQTAAND